MKKKVIPSNEIRRIDRIDVFWITVFWSTMAYVWLYLILCVFSPNIIDVIKLQKQKCFIHQV